MFFLREASTCNLKYDKYKILNMNRLFISAMFLIVLLVTGFTLIKEKKSDKPPEDANEKNALLTAGEVKWLSFEEAQKLSLKNPRKIFVDVYTDWCGWCKKMDKTALKDPMITEYLDKKYYAVKLNAESEKKFLFKGKEITERELANKVFKATGYPTTVYLDEKLNVLQPISSYLETEMLDKILHYYGDDYYKNTSWDSFESIYSKGAN
jgi:thioredoxin-related protein